MEEKTTDNRNTFAIKTFLKDYLDLRKDKDNEHAAAATAAAHVIARILFFIFHSPCHSKNLMLLYLYFLSARKYNRRYGRNYDKSRCNAAVSWH